MSLSLLSGSCAALVLLAFPALSIAQDLPKVSPFLPQGTAASAGALPAARYQLGGIITQGKEVLVSITRVSNRQSFWIPVGGTVNEVTVVSCNSDRDEATLSANGEKFTLSLRKTVVQAGNGGPPVTSDVSPQAAPTPPLPAPVGPPEVQEREARMLVTDLLEIGQQQRKAYEEAQKKAAADKK